MKTPIILLCFVLSSWSYTQEHKTIPNQKFEELENKVHDKTEVLSPHQIEEKTIDEVFRSAYHAYYCSFLLSDKINKIEEAQFLRWYSLKLFTIKVAPSNDTRNWNDINLTAPLDTLGLSDNEVEMIFRSGGECSDLYSFSISTISEFDKNESK